jgi:hypothetical protein
MKQIIRGDLIFCGNGAPATNSKSTKVCGNFKYGKRNPPQCDFLQKGAMAN